MFKKKGKRTRKPLIKPVEYHSTTDFDFDPKRKEKVHYQFKSYGKVGDKSYKSERGYNNNAKKGFSYSKQYE